MSGREVAVAGNGAVTRADDAPQSLVQLAIEKGVDVEVIERLVALQERVTERNARAAYFEALANFQEQCPEIPKNKTADIVSKRSGGKFSYTYARLEDITRTIREPLRQCALSYTWDVSLDSGALVVTCIVRHVDGHSERSSFPVPVDKSDRMSDAQATGAALTYGRRQSLIAALGLTTADEDTDGVSGRGRKQASADEPERLTDQQLADLSALIEDVGADRRKFLAYLRVEKLEDVHPREYARAIEALEAKRAQ